MCSKIVLVLIAIYLIRLIWVCQVTVLLKLQLKRFSKPFQILI